MSSSELAPKLKIWMDHFLEEAVRHSVKKSVIFLKYVNLNTWFEWIVLLYYQVVHNSIPGI